MPSNVLQHSFFCFVFIQIVILLVISATLLLTASSFEQKDIAESPRNSEDKSIEEANNKPGIINPQETPRSRKVHCRRYKMKSIKTGLERQNLSKFGIRLIRVSGKLLKMLKAKKTIIRPIRRYRRPAHRGKQQKLPLCKEDPVNVMTLASDVGFAYTFNSVKCGSKQNCQFFVGQHALDVGRCEQNKKQITVRVFRRRGSYGCRRFGSKTIEIACACQCYRFQFSCMKF